MHLSPALAVEAEHARGPDLQVEFRALFRHAPSFTPDHVKEVAGPIAGFGLHHELRDFVQDGLTPYQALETATIHPARYLRQAAEMGTIEVGKRADLVLLASNPITNISDTQNIAGVMARGRWLDANDLTRRLHKVPNEYRHELEKVQAMLQSDASRAVRYLADQDPFGQLAAFSIAELAAKESVADLVRTLQEMRNADPNAETVSEDGINTLGYTLMNKKIVRQAIAVLALSTETVPKSANAWDSLADAFFHSGDISKAALNYQKALAIDGAYANAEFARKFLVEHAEK